MIKEKIFSGRYFSTVTMVGTYCLAILISLFLTAKGKISVNTFLGLFSGFAGLTGFIVKAYFDREDRKKETGS